MNKSISVFLIYILFENYSFCQSVEIARLNVVDANSLEKIPCEGYWNIKFQSVYEWFGEIWTANCDPVQTSSSWQGLIIDVDMSNIRVGPLELIAYWSVRINSPGYEEKYIQGQTRVEKEFKLFEHTYYDSYPIEQTVYLVSLKRDVNISGNLNLQNTPMVSNNDPDFFSAAQIADKLKIRESDVVGLIQSKKLKGFKVENNYFIKKENFYEYLELESQKVH